MNDAEKKAIMNRLDKGELTTEQAISMMYGGTAKKTGKNIYTSSYSTEEKTEIKKRRERETQQHAGKSQEEILSDYKSGKLSAEDSAYLLQKKFDKGEKPIQTGGIDTGKPQQKTKEAKAELETFKKELEQKQLENPTEEKSWLLNQISTVTGTAGAIAGGSIGGPAGAVVGAGAGAGLGEMLENVIMGEPISTNVAKTVAIDAALMGAGVGILKLFGKLSKTARLGKLLQTTEGLSNPNVAKAASGIFKKVDILGTPIKTRVATTGKKFVTNVKIPINTVYANRVIRLLAASTQKFKFQYLVMGAGSSFVLNGFLDEESIQNLDFEISKLESAKDYESALTLIEMKEEIQDLDFWQVVSWLVPGTGVVKYMQAGGLKTSSQRRRLEKAMGESAKQKVELEENAAANPEEAEPPKWKQVNGKWTPNLDNPLWIKEDGRNVWTGD